MEFEVTAQRAEIEFNPGDRTAEILQNVRTIISTVRFSVPLDRRFGIDGSLIDLPTPAAAARLTKEVIEVVQRYEPRVKVTKIDFVESEESSGILRPKVQVRLI